MSLTGHGVGTLDIVWYFGLGCCSWLRLLVGEEWI